ncbi:MAG: glucokinase [Betaproteobacteria bacterium]|nr:glucokinase [Betaproteobacteria bacterium]
MNHFIAGDIGGTKTLLQISAADRAREPLLQKSYANAGYAGLAEILDEFLREADASDVTAACFALACPISGRRVKLTNLPWEVDADALAARFAISRISLINDFEAVGLSVAALQPADLLTLQAGKPQAQGVRAVVGAGTGLGVAWLSWQDDSYAVHPSEGGHMDFAPADAIQCELLQYLQRRHSHVSYERIVSGPGLIAIFEFLRDTGRGTPSAQLVAATKKGDAASAITQFSQRGDEPAARMALDLFLRIYGAFAGNVALATLPRGGVYVAGGIAAKIAATLRQGVFLRAFLDKGRFAGLLETLPLHIVTNPQAGLLGAGLTAQRMA